MCPVLDLEPSCDRVYLHRTLARSLFAIFNSPMWLHSWPQVMNSVLTAVHEADIKPTPTPAFSRMSRSEFPSQLAFPMVILHSFLLYFCSSFIFSFTWWLPTSASTSSCIVFTSFFPSTTAPQLRCIHFLISGTLRLSRQPNTWRQPD